MKCEEMCSKERPVGCQHSCPLACHPGSCPPCKQRLRMRCHCNTQVIYSDCQTFTNATEEQKEKIKSCGKRCSKQVIFHSQCSNSMNEIFFQLACGHPCTYSCHSGSCSPLTSCSQLVPVRCACRRIHQELPCCEVNAIKNYRLPCDETCAEVKKNRLATATTTTTAPVVEEVVEEIKPVLPVETPVTKRKNRKTNPIESTPTTTPSPSVKKPRPRRFVWTLEKVLLLFSLFIIITVSSIIYMFKQIA